MNANELRIGNWLIRLDGSVFQTNASDINIIDRMPIHLRPKPIPLTEEWLLKFGFGYRDSISYSGWYSPIHAGRSIRIYKDGVWGYKYAYSEVSLVYVHQLQNLYFALIGEELEIK